MRDKCRVIGCQRDAEKMWEPLMHRHGAEAYHFNRDRLFADGGGEMQGRGEMLRDECAAEEL